MIFRRRASLCAIPFNLIGVLMLYPEAACVVLTMMEEDKGPTDWGANVAWKEKLLPAVTISGMIGRPLIIKFGFPINERAVTWRAVLA